MFKELGYKLPTTHLVDPHASLRRMRMAPRIFPLLLRKERQLRAKYAGGWRAPQRGTNGRTDDGRNEGTNPGTDRGTNAPCYSAAGIQGNPDLEVY